MTSQRRTETVQDIFSEPTKKPIERQSSSDTHRDQMTPSFKMHHDWMEAGVRPQVTNRSTNEKGAYGEAVMDRWAIKQMGWERLDGPNPDQMAQASSPIVQGIDAVYRDKKTGDYVVAEAKYGTAGLGSALNAQHEKVGQMSDQWIDGKRWNSSHTRLEGAVGEEKASEIRTSGYRKLLFRTK